MDRSFKDTIACSGLQALHRVFERFFCSFCILLLVEAVATPCQAHDDNENPLPMVFMLEVRGVTPSDPALFDAIRAQLSAAALVLDRVQVSRDRDFAANPLPLVSATARETNADVVFWIEDKEICRLFFYVPDANGGEIHSRTLELDLNSSWSRFQTIAIAAAYTVEGLLVSLGIKPVPKVQEHPTEVAPHSKRRTTVAKTRRFEISAAYAGSLFAAGTVTNGGCLEIGFRPLSHFIVAASFTQNTPITIRTDEYQFSILSRNIEVSTAGRFLMGSVEMRFGVAWYVALSSFSATFMSSTIERSPDGFKGVYNLMPFVSVVWRFSDRIGLMGRAGAAFAINENDYKIRRIEGATDVLTPLLVKMTYQLGLIIEL